MAKRIKKSADRFNVDKLPAEIVGTWHPRKTFRIGAGSVTVVSTITGCGLCQLYGSSSLSTYTIQEKEKALLDVEKMKAEMKTNGCGLIICTLGNGYYASCHKTLLSLGFKEMYEYHNWRHGAEGKQRIYILETGISLEIEKKLRAEKAALKKEAAVKE